MGLGRESIRYYMKLTLPYILNPLLITMDNAIELRLMQEAKHDIYKIFTVDKLSIDRIISNQQTKSRMEKAKYEAAEPEYMQGTNPDIPLRKN